MAWFIVSTSARVIERIEVLNEQLNKETKHIKPIRILRKSKIKDINERLQLNWDRLYEFYPDMTSITDISTFKEMLSAGLIPNRIKEELLDSKIYTVDSKDWKDFLDTKGVS